MNLNEEVLEAFGLEWVWKFLPPGDYMFTYATGDVPDAAVDHLRYKLIPIERGFSFLCRMGFKTAPKKSIHYAVSLIFPNIEICGNLFYNRKWHIFVR